MFGIACVCIIFCRVITARGLSIGEDKITPPTRFNIDGEITRQYRRFNATGTEITVRLLSPPDRDDTNPMSHFEASVTELFEYALHNCQDSDMLGLTIRNKVNVQDKLTVLVSDGKFNYPKM